MESLCFTKLGDYKEIRQLIKLNNESLSHKIENILLEKGIVLEAKKIFGGMAFMINDKMCVGVLNDQIMTFV